MIFCRSIFMWVSLLGAGALTAAGVAVWCHAQGYFPGRRLLFAYRRLPWPVQAFLTVFVFRFVLFGGGKPNQTDNVEGGTTNAAMVTAGAVLGGPRGRGPYGAVQTAAGAAWGERGAWDDDFFFSFADEWVFPFGTNHLGGVLVHSQGNLASSSYDMPFASLPFAASMVPGESSFVSERTVSNSYAFVWTGVRPVRTAEETVDARIELFRNGDISVSTNGVSTFTPREIPFPHVGIGQNDDWVRTNFVNAVDILAVGYANWVDDQVGVDLENGLYKFTATFPDDPPEATQLTVGELSVVITNAGEYVFLMEKGVEYSFGTTPYDATVEYTMQGDVGPDAEIVSPAFSVFNSPFSILSSWWGGDGNGAWSIDGGWYGLYPPTLFGFGSCYWMPTFRGSPDVTNVSSSDFPMTFTAMLTDCCRTNGVTYRWSTEDDKILIASPYSQSTAVSLDPTFDEATFSLSVEAFTPERDYYSTLHYAFPTNSHRGLSFSLQAPKVVFLNDDRRTSRWYSVTMTLASPVPTNAVVSIMHSGNTGISHASDACGEEPLTMADMAFSVAEAQGEASRQFFFACENLRAGTFESTCTFPDGKVMTTNRHYKVIEPLRKLVSTDIAQDGSYVNPSRLVYGTNAWLWVDQNGGYSGREVVWRIVSGPGAIVSTNQYCACVRATAPTGTVVVEAAFGSDARVQPRFVLPVVVKKRIPLRVYYVKDAQESPPERLSLLEDDLYLANRIFSQVGVEFYHEATAQPIANQNYSRLPVHGIVIDGNGHRRLTDGLSPHLQALIGMLPTNDAVRIVYVSEITHGTSLGFSVPSHKLIVMGSQGSSNVLSHELGHIVGMEDIYSRRKTSSVILMPGWNDQAHREIFSDEVNDWGEECGRAFYEAGDTHGELIDSLLMNGFDGFGGIDIPSGSVRGYSTKLINAFDIQPRCVGADTIVEEL